MRKHTLITSLQTFFGTTKNELIVVSVVLSGLLGGVVIKAINGGYPHTAYYAVDAAGLDRLLDSMALAEQSTYVGITPDGEAVPDLAAGDTLVAKESLFPAPVKKEVPAGAIDLNSASRDQLLSLPGVGPATADKILAQREIQPFRRPEDIMRIKGIGVKKFEKMRPFIVVQRKQ
jgi:DNA uptake protein ComE-like DNA-binding protein